MYQNQRNLLLKWEINNKNALLQPNVVPGDEILEVEDPTREEPECEVAPPKKRFSLPTISTKASA